MSVCDGASAVWCWGISFVIYTVRFGVRRLQFAVFVCRLDKLVKLDGVFRCKTCQFYILCSTALLKWIKNSELPLGTFAV